MSNKFLSTSSSTGSVSDGTTTLFGSSIGASNLRPSYPVKTNSLRQLVSEKLDVSDINNLQIQLDNVVQIPYPGTFIATDYESQTQNSFNDTLQKIDNFQPSTATDTTVSGTINTDTIKVNEIFDPTGTSTLQFSPTYIGILGANLQVNGNNITQVNDITANRFIVDNGTNIQYLLADGSTISQSANSGNSNFYLYTSINTSNAPPITSGHVEYNNANQSLATIVYLSHLTRDNIDIEIFLQNISTLNILYIQDQNDSTNFIRYDITGTPTIFINNYLQIPVSILTSSGTGSTTFGASHNVLVSFFTNNQEINTRISTVETNTQNQTAVSNTTTFAGIISSSGLNMNSNKITNLATPTLSTDAVNKNYVDTATTIKNYANIGFNGNATTISLAANVFVSMPPTFVNHITPIGFTLTTPVGGILTYTGTNTKTFHITFNGICAGSLLAAPNLYVYIRKNGSNIPPLQTNLTFPNNNQYWVQYSGNAIISLSTNDIITTVVASTVGTATFLFYQYSLSIIQID